MNSSDLRNSLVRAALDARERAYSPYSDFAVGAALMDADGDSLTLEDFQGAQLGPGPYGAGHHARRAKMREQADLRKKSRFQLMDSDGDGVVTPSEHDAFTEHVFLEADADDDGYLTFQELQQHNRGM